MKKVILFLETLLIFIPVIIKAETYNGWEYEDLYDKSGLYITGYSGTEKNVTIPSKINGKVVSAISIFAFEGTEIETLHIPASIIKSNVNPFQYAKMLKEITVDSDNKDYTAIDGVIFTADKKTLIAYPIAKEGSDYIVPEGTVEIGKNAFSDNKYLKNVTIPGSVDLINPFAFSGCKSLEKLIINANLIGMGNYVISHNPKLKEVIFNGTAKWFSNYTFSDLPVIEKIQLPTYMEELDEKWIYNCNPNVKYDIPSMLKDIGNGHYSYVIDVHLLLNSYNYDFAKKVLELINIERAKNNLEPLKLDYDLTEQAMLRSAELTAYFAHTRPNGGDALDLPKVNGENIAAGQYSPEEVVDTWMNSSSHKSNILNANFKSIGIGCVKYGTYFWTQLFSTEDATNENIKSGVVPIDNVEVSVRKSLLGELIVYFEQPKTVKILGLNETIQPYSIGFLNAGWEGHYVDISPLDVEISSSDERIFTVDKNGVLTGNNLGSAKVHFKLLNLEKDIDVKVVETIKVPKQIIMKVGDTYKIPVTYYPESAKDKYTIYWGSTIDYFYVTDDGVIKATDPGTADIYANLSNGYTTKINVIVVEDYLKGDLNSNMQIDMPDVYIALKIALNHIEPTELQTEIGDINDTGSIDMADTYYILKTALNIA